MRSVVGQVFRYAIATARAVNDPIALRRSARLARRGKKAASDIREDQSKAEGRHNR
jgi:hypothetical protein